jgi:hypothetical protein
MHACLRLCGSPAVGGVLWAAPTLLVTTQHPFLLKRSAEQLNPDVARRDRGHMGNASYQPAPTA